MNLKFFKSGNSFTTILMMFVIICIFLFSKQEYIFNPKNDVGGFVFPVTVLKIWNESSPSEYNFCPVLTYQNSGDKFITYYKRLEDKDGNNYYVSSPPFSYIMAYYAISFFHLPMDEFSIKFLNVIILIFGALLIYFIMNLILNENLMKFSVPSFISMAVFLFMPVNINITGYSYFPEIFLWLQSIFLFLFIIKKNCGNIYMFFLFGISLFLVIYTEWIGLFFSFSVLLFSLFKIREKLFQKFFIITLIFSFLPLLLTFIQFSSLNGIGAMVHAMKIRFLERSGFFGATLSADGIHIFSCNSWIVMLENINRSLIGFGYLAIIMVIFLFVFRRKMKFKFNYKSVLVYVILLPALIHFIVFFNSNAVHKEQMSKFSVWVAIICGYVFYQIQNKYQNKILSSIIISLVIFTAIISHYILLNNYSDIADYTVMNQQSKYIKENAMPDEAVFISRDSTSNRDTKIFFSDYILTFLCDRNLKYANGEDDAVSIAKKLGKEKGIYFKLNNDIAKCTTYHFTITSK
ncbi:MAG TPA: hypothetical protein PKK00_01235 [Bacteroidales bacterium]|nr:hypothetical protein [Bacteroidales bacterium]HPS16059.1 hypothetical protein [Bacteroidales bacterium]